MDRRAADSFHALHEKDGGEGSAPDFIGEVALVVLDIDRRELLGQVRVAEIATGQLGLQETLNDSLPVPAFGGHASSPDSMRESSYTMFFPLTRRFICTRFGVVEHRIWCRRGPTFPSLRSRKDALAERRCAHVG